MDIYLGAPPTITLSAMKVCLLVYYVPKDTRQQWKSLKVNLWQPLAVNSGKILRA